MERRPREAVQTMCGIVRRVVRIALVPSPSWWRSAGDSINRPRRAQGRLTRLHAEEALEHAQGGPALVVGPDEPAVPRAAVAGARFPVVQVDALHARADLGQR